MTILKSFYFNLKYRFSLCVITFGLAIFFANTMSYAQTHYINRKDNLDHFADRINHLYLNDTIIHRSVRPLAHGDVYNSILNLKQSSLSLSDKYNLSHSINTLGLKSDSLVQDNHGFWNLFYLNKAHFLEVEHKDFSFVLNPTINIQFGRDSKNDQSIYLNHRGIELWGQLDNKFYFYSSFFENQAKFFNYIEAYIEKYKSIPGQGNYKFFDSKLFNIKNGFDFSNANAYLGYRISKNSQLELGHGRHFFGNGIRSLLLSDFSNNYFYLKFNVRVWKIHYQSILAELNTGSSRFMVGDELLPKKYMATHYLSFKPSHKFEIGLFETVVFSRENHFEFQYLNPVILYRTVEFFLDSPDNVIIGLNFNWHLLKNSSLYGQLVLDEFKTSEFFNNPGWWGNKFGYQFGFKNFDFLGIENLDLNLEYNVVRPYTYSHNVSSPTFPALAVSSFSHNNQALAHPLGANFAELILNLRYQPFGKMVINGRFIYTQVGRNTEENFGQDILINNDSRFANFDNTLLQGAKSTITNLDLSVSYEFVHGLYLDGFLKIRSDNNESFEDVNNNYFGMGFRYNISNTSIDY
ncbi:MAG: hypothetical protein HKN51_00580 [Saprospiraceae bacterium]|nr:hypothetical protein [Saprospiraceae bacterium]